MCLKFRQSANWNNRLSSSDMCVAVPLSIVARATQQVLLRRDAVSGTLVKS